MLKKLCILAVALSLVHTVFASEQLKKRTYLGVGPAAQSGSEGVVVGQILPGGTGAKLGLEVGDKILGINGKPIPSFTSLLSSLGKITAGTELVVDIERDGKANTLRGVAISRTPENYTDFRVEYGQVEYLSEQLRSIVYHPKNPRKDRAGVFFIQGYTCGSIDYGMIPDITINQLLGSYAKAGFTVMKLEKPGVGDSAGDMDCAEIDFDTEHAAFVAGIHHFKRMPDVAGDRIFVFGHSLGVLHAARIAPTGLVKGVMGYGGVLKSWYEYTKDIYTEQSTKHFSVSQSQANQNLRRIEPFLNAWLNTEQSWESMLDDEDLKEIMNSDLIPISGETVFSRHYQFFRNLNQVDFEQHWKDTKAEVLLLHGNFDIQAIDETWAHAIAKSINAQGNHTAIAHEFPGTEHALLRYPTKAALMSAMRSGENNAGNPGDKYNPEIASVSLRWMQDVLN